MTQRRNYEDHSYGTSMLGGLILGAAAGAAAMYLLDPDSGLRRRRHLGRITSEAFSGASEGLGSTVQNLGQRAREMRQTAFERARGLGQSVSEQARDIGQGISERTGDWGQRLAGGLFSGEAARQIGAKATERAAQMGRRLSRRARELASESSSMMPRRPSTTTSILTHTATAVACLALGAGLMYMLDPARGRVRRAVVRDKAVSGWNRMSDSVAATSKDVWNRTTGMAREVSSRFRSEQVSDDVLVNRVRARIGRVLASPRLVDVLAQEGVVTLRGTVPASELPQVLATASAVRGVRGIENHLSAQQPA